MAEQWYPAGVVVPGAPGKTASGENRKAGVTFHSAEGWLPGLFAEVQDPASAKSWHFSIALDGAVYQHYALDARCWHSGNTVGNADTIGIEHEGVSGWPVTGVQLAASIALVRWLAQQCAWWDGLDGRLFEHRAWTTTACPSGRIPLAAYTLPAPEPPAPLPRLLNVASNADVQAWLAPLGNALTRYNPRGWTRDPLGRRLALYEVAVLLPEDA